MFISTWALEPTKFSLSTMRAASKLVDVYKRQILSTRFVPASVTSGRLNADTMACPDTSPALANASLRWASCSSVALASAATVPAASGPASRSCCSRPWSSPRSPNSTRLSLSLIHIWQNQADLDAQEQELADQLEQKLITTGEYNELLEQLNTTRAEGLAQEEEIAARRAELDTQMAALDTATAQTIIDLSLIHICKLLGFDDFVKEYKGADPDAFAPDKTPPTVTVPGQGRAQPKAGQAYVDDKYKNNPFYHPKGE